MTTPAWIGLGSNLGDREGVLDAAVAALADAPGVTVRAASSYHETSPVGGPAGQGAFLNAAAHLETTLDPHQLLAALQEVENRAGRVREVRWGERTLDLDILIYGCKFLETPELRLPHPRLAFRRFVLAPLAEIAPTIVDVVSKRSIADLLANLDAGQGRIAIHGPPGPSRSRVFRRLVEELPAAAISEGEVAHDRPLGRSAGLIRKLEAFDEEPWREGPGTPRWVVADHCVGLDLSRSSSTPRALPEEWPDPRSRHEGMVRFKDGMRRARRPTFVVVMPEVVGTGRRPGLIDIPLLWPDSSEPDAIVDEVLATCRSIEEPW